MLKPSTALGAMFIACIAPGWSAAQAPAQPAPQQSGQLEEIVVTAQKRSENLQNVPLTVTAFNADALARANVVNAQDLTAVAPGLIVDAGTGVIRPFLRGIGNPSINVGNESSVAFYVDGVYYGRLPISFFEFNNIARVEVLAGPQGTLFGRNASGGLVQIVTREPTQKDTLHAEVGYGNFQTTKATLYAAGGITDNLAADISLLYKNQGQGWGRDITTNLDQWFEDVKAARGKLVFTPGDATKLILAAGYLWSRNDLGLPLSQFEGTTVGSSPGFPPVVYNKLPNFYDTRENDQGYTKDEGYDASIQLEHEFSFMSFKSLTAYQHARGAQLFDADFTPDPYFLANLNYLTKQTTQEFQFASPQNSPVTWIFGLFYMNQLAAYDPTQFTEAIAGPPGFALDLFGQQRIRSYAAYTQGTAQIFDATNFTAGVRYTYDKIGASGHNDLQMPGGVTIPNLPPGYLSNDVLFQKVTYKAALDHHFSDEMMGYLSYSRGFKDGTYVLLPFDPQAINPEVVDSYELGTKTEWFDRRIRVNASVFYNRIKDPQVFETRESFIVYANAGAAESKGVEVSTEARLTDYLTSRLGVTYLHATYTDFPNSPCTTPNPVTGGNNPYTTCNADGHYLSHSPPVTVNLGLDYMVPTAAGNLDAALTYYFNDGYYFDPDQGVKQKAFSLLNAQVGWTLPDGHWHFTAWAKNLTDTKYYSFEGEQGSNGGNYAAPAAPRTYGMTVGLDF